MSQGLRGDSWSSAPHTRESTTRLCFARWCVLSRRSARPVARTQSIAARLRAAARVRRSPTHCVARVACAVQGVKRDVIASPAFSFLSFLDQVPAIVEHAPLSTSPTHSSRAQQQPVLRRLYRSIVEHISAAPVAGSTVVLVDDLEALRVAASSDRELAAFVHSLHMLRNHTQVLRSGRWGAGL